MKRAFSRALMAGGLGALLALSGCGAGANQQGSQSNGNHSGTQTAGNVQVVHVTATNFKWTLDKTALSADKPIEFEVTSKEGTHGFSIVGTSVNEAISQGQNEQVTWTPPKAGRYIIRCDIYCGNGHPNMFTAFTVK